MHISAVWAFEVLAQIVWGTLWSWEWLKWELMLVGHVCFSVHRALADVLLDRKLQNPWAVHGGLRPVCMLVVYPRCHCATGLDAPGTHRHYAQSPGVDAHGRFPCAASIVVKHHNSDCLELDLDPMILLNGWLLITSSLADIPKFSGSCQAVISYPCSFIN